MSDYHGLPVHTLSNGLITLDVLAESGPRIVRLEPFGRGNLLAEHPEVIATPYGDYHLRGGHRLWHAPEAMPRSYIPDDGGLRLEVIADGVSLTGSTEAATGITKSMEIRLPAGRPRVAIRHSLRNDGAWPVELAPWAITMFRLGGTAVLPQAVGPAGANDLLPNRILALWPYATIGDPRLTLGDDYLLIRAFPHEAKFKIGSFNPYGWMGYWFDGVFFRKRFDVVAGTPHTDGGCNSEIYADQYCLELESLGPLTRLNPGETVHHDEMWEIEEGPEEMFLPLAKSED